MASSLQAAGDLFGGLGADRDGVKACILEAGALMTQGAMARAAEAKVEQAASADGHSVAAGAADVLAWAVAEAQRSPEDYRLWSALQLAGIVLGRTVLRDWSAVWSAAQGGDDGEAIKHFIEGLLMSHAAALASRNGQACLGHLGDVWASVMKLRVGTAVSAGDDAQADRMMEGLHGGLVELATGAQGGGSADVGVATVSRMVVLRSIEEFGLFNKRSQRRGLPLSVHDDLRVRFHTATLPALWAQCVPAFLSFAAAAWESPAAAGMSDGSALSSPEQWMLFRVIHAMLNWRFIRPVSSTGAELGAMQVDGAPGVLPITCGAAWKAGLEANAGGYSLPLAVALMVAEAAQRQRRVEAAGRTGIAVGPFAAMTAHQVDEVGSMASEALLQLCSIFAADDEGWTPGERGEYAASLMRLAFQIAQNVLGTAAGNADHGAALRTAACCVERVVSAVGTADGLFHAAGLNDIHDQLAGMTEAVVNVAAAFLDNYSDDASEEEQHVSEALERLLRAWAVILNSAFGDVTMRCRLDAAGASEPLAAAVTRVFKCYVTAKVTQQLQGAAGGSAAVLGRGGGSTAGNHDADGGAAEHSTEFVASHLQSIGLLARERPDETSAFLAQAMAAVVDQLNACIPTSMGGRASDDETPPEPPGHVCEALWYLLRIAGHFIADDDQSERPCIPSALCAHAVRAEGELEANGIDDPEERAAALVRNNAFFGLFNSLMTFTRTIEALVRAELDNGMPVTMPPSIIESLVFFLHRHAATYLAADPDMQADYTLGFENIEAIICAAETTLRFVATSLAAYPGERTCVDECIATLKALADKPTLAEWILQQPEVQTFLSVSIGNGHFQLPFDARGALVGLLCSIAAQATPEGDAVTSLDPAYAASCLETPTYATSLILRHRTEPHGVCLADALAAPAQQAMATQQVDFAAASAAASTLRGVLRHLQNPNVVAEACEVLLPAMTGLSALVGPGSPFGHHLPLNTAVIDMLDTIIDSCSTFLPTPLMDQALNVMHGVVETAVARLQEGFSAAAKAQQQQGSSHHTSGLKSQEEDERCDLLARATRLLLSCATWGAFDLSDPTQEGDESALRHQRVSHFCVRGLVAILGIVWSSPDLLNIPDVGSPIYRLLREVADTHSDALLSLPSPAEAEAILWFIRTAVSVADVDLNLSAFGTVSALAKHARRVAVQSGKASGLEARLGDFLDDLWATYVACAVDVTAVSSFAWAIMSLGGCLGAERTYQSWAQAFATKQQTVNPDSPAGRLIDGMIGGAISSTNFTTKTSQHSSAFAGELSAALAVLRGASVTL